MRPKRLLRRPRPRDFLPEIQSNLDSFQWLQAEPPDDFGVRAYRALNAAAAHFLENANLPVLNA
jgi:hypothetical protein